MTDILTKNDYKGLKKVYVSCEYEKSKATGELYEVVKKDLNIDDKAINNRWIHVGDNEKSDVRMARRAGLAVHHYPNVNRMALSMGVCLCWDIADLFMIIVSVTGWTKSCSYRETGIV